MRDEIKEAVRRVNSTLYCGRCGNEIDEAYADVIFEESIVGKTPICDDCFREFWQHINEQMEKASRSTD